jgi:hypothetical protein
MIKPDLHEGRGVKQTYFRLVFERDYLRRLINTKVRKYKVRKYLRRYFRTKVLSKVRTKVSICTVHVRVRS